MNTIIQQSVEQEERELMYQKARKLLTSITDTKERFYVISSIGFNIIMDRISQEIVYVFANDIAISNSGDINVRGIEYASDYATTYSNRSIVTNIFKARGGFSDESGDIYRVCTLLNYDDEIYNLAIKNYTKP